MIEKNVVLSSSLFAVSTKKAKIMAALTNPLNAELIQQSVSDLPEDTITQLEERSDQESGSGEVSPVSEGAKSITSDPKPIKFKVANKVPTENTTSQGSGESPNELEGIAENSTAETETVEVTSSTSVDCVVLDSGVIKSTLNSREDTCGVVSIAIKEDGASELWVYYDDETNLNDTIYSVVSVFNSCGYNMLKFNRLARSNNAIVFDVLEIKQPIKSIVEVQNEA